MRTPAIFLPLVLLVPIGRGAALPATVDAHASLVAKKRAELHEVLGVLRARDVSHLDAARAARRARVLDALQDYAARGEFCRNTRFPGRAMPYVIDDVGTRCALAWCMDRTGAGDLVLALAAADNHAFLAERPHERGIVRWLDENGLSLEEACYIQGPFQPPPADPPAVPAPEPAVLVGPPSNDSASDAGFGSPAVPGASGGVPGGTVSRTRAGRAHGKKAHAATAAATWTGWWNMNREGFVNLRGNYHDGPARTGSGLQARPRQLRRDQVAKLILPLLEKFAHGEEQQAAVAILSMAQAADAETAASVLPLALDYLQRNDARHREYAALAIGVLGDPGGVAPLIDIATDSPRGRRLVRETQRIDERVRAFAALGLGLCGDAAAVDALAGILRDESGGSLDPRAAAVTALGLVARQEALGRTALPVLHRALADAELPTQVLAHVPAALARAGDPVSLPALLGVVARFEGPVEIRRAAALALGSFRDPVDAEVVERLVAAARRDPDPTVRHFAIMSLGELSAGVLRAEGEQEVLERLRRFHADGVSGFFRQQADLPWHALAGALFARHRPAAATDVLEALRARARDDAHLEMRAAAALALGLARDHAAEPVLRQVLDARGAPLCTGYAAEALGLLGAPGAVAPLRALVAGDQTEWVRYQAAIALAHLADAEGVATLVEAMSAERSDSVRAVFSRALGEIGDAQAIDALAALAAGGRRNDMTRAQAIAALGLVGRPGDASWLVGLKRGFDASIATPAVLDVVTRLY